MKSEGEIKYLKYCRWKANHLILKIKYVLKYPSCQKTADDLLMRAVKITSYNKASDHLYADKNC